MRTGIINIDKSEGTNSTHVVSVVKKLTHVSGCGHMGTLDPMASGVLPVAVGNATRLFDFFLAKRKTYIAEFAFGLSSDTLDTTGDVVPCGTIPTAEEIEAALPAFVGDIDQLPPRYSAKRVNGRRGYAMARQGQDFELQPAQVTVYSYRLLGPVNASGDSRDIAPGDSGTVDPGESGTVDPGESGTRASDSSADSNLSGRFRFEIECGKGTYIRSLARDLGAALGTGAVMSALRRTKSGPFTLENAVRLEDLTEENIEQYIIPTQDLLDMDEVHVSGHRQKQLLCGCAADASGLHDGLYKMFLSDGSFYGLCEAENNVLRVTKKLC